MPPPLPRRSIWTVASLISSRRSSLPRKGCRVGLRIVLFEACSACTRVAACTLALPPIRDTLIEGFSHFVTSMTALIASGRSGRRVGLAPTGKRRLVTAHTPVRPFERSLRFVEVFRMAVMRGRRVDLFLDGQSITAKCQASIRDVCYSPGTGPTPVSRVLRIRARRQLEGH